MKHPRHGFTLIELLTVIATIAILIAILIPLVGSIRAKATTAEATAALREIGTAANIFVAESGGFICPPGGQKDSYPSSLNRYLGGSWAQTLTPYVSNFGTDIPFRDLPQIFTCPRWDSVQSSRGQENWNQSQPWIRGFGMNLWFYQTGQLNYPSMNADLQPVRMLQVDNPSKQLYVTTSDSFYQSLSPWDVATYLGKGELGPARYAEASNPYLFLDGHVEVLSPEELRTRVN